MDLRPARPASRDGFEIAIICALPLEADAVEALFDHFWDDDGIPFDKAAGDPNTYSTGTIGRHNVVLACLPGMEKVNAATVAINCRVSFPNIKLGLVVGIAGVVPFGPDGQEIILGDVIISDAIIQYDFGRQLPERFVRKDTLLDSPGRPNMEIRTFLASLKRLRRLKSLGSDIAEHLDALRKESQLAATYPGVEHDKLFEPKYRHLGDKDSCDKAGCNGKLVARHRLQASPDSSPTPAIHFGLIACGDTVMKSGEDRDAVAVAESVISFEMEGTGVWDVLPCVVIKGGCDYADSHKNKKWQRYAAATAAACMKAFLRTWIPSSTATAGRLESSTECTAKDDCQYEPGEHHTSDRPNMVLLKKTIQNEDITFRVRGVPADWDADRLQSFLTEQDGAARPILQSLAREIHGKSLSATVTFHTIPSPLQALPTEKTWNIYVCRQFGVRPESLSLDANFFGMTTLFMPPKEHHKIE